LKKRSDFVASFKNELFIYAATIEPGARYGEGVIGDIQKDPDRQAGPDAAEENGEGHTHKSNVSLIQVSAWKRVRAIERHWVVA